MQTSGRPLPLHGAAEEVLIDYSIWERRAMRDGRIDDREAQEAVTILRSLVSPLSELIPTITHISQCLNGRDGMFSHRAVRGWNEAQRKRPANVLTFRAREHDDPEVA